MSIKDKIKELATSDNIAESLDEQELMSIAEEVLKGLDEDELSMDDWLRDSNKAMELTDIKREEKNFPFKGAANVKYPLTTLAVVQFSSRTLPELIKNGDVCKYKIVGGWNPLKDRKGKRLSSFVNYQILEQMPNWLDERDRLLSQLAVVGTCYVKTWYDPIIEQNRSELMPYDLIKVNDNIKNLDDAPRISQYMYLKKNDIIEQQRYDLYRDISLDNLKDASDPEDQSYYEFVEQHCWLNLVNDDENDYKQPYIVTIHKRTREVMRIVARFRPQDVKYNKKEKIKSIKAQQYFSDYHFIPSPRGKFHSLGFGTLLLDMNAMANSLLNQLLNCGTLSMARGGFYDKSLRIRPDDMQFEPNEYKPVDGGATDKPLAQCFYSVEAAPPNPVLFNLLSVLLDSGKELSSSTEALTGSGDAVNVSPNTLLAQIQQGLKVFTAIQRRIFRGFKKELQRIMALNAEYVGEKEYLRVVNVSPDELQEMYSPAGKFIEFDQDFIDVVPVADLASSTEAERLMKASAAFQYSVQLMQTAPGTVDPKAVARELFEALDFKNLDELVPPPAPPGPNIEAIKLQSEVDAKGKELMLKEQELQIRSAQAQAQIQNLQSQTVKNMADAQLKGVEVQVDAMNKAMDNESYQRQLQLQANKQQIEEMRLQKEAMQMGIDAKLRIDEMKSKERNRSDQGKDKSNT